MQLCGIFVTLVDGELTGLKPYYAWGLQTEIDCLDTRMLADHLRLADKLKMLISFQILLRMMPISSDIPGKVKSSVTFEIRLDSKRSFFRT